MRILTKLKDKKDKKIILVKHPNEVEKFRLLVNKGIIEDYEILPDVKK